MSFFFFNDTATTEIYTLSLHDALPISDRPDVFVSEELTARFAGEPQAAHVLCLGITPDDHARLQERAGDVEAVAEYLQANGIRSEEHTSELQSRQYLVCRLLLEKKKKK